MRARRQSALIAILFCVMGLLAAYRLYEFHMRPIDPVPFVDLVVSKGYLVSFEPLGKRKPDTFDIHVNERYRAPDRFSTVFAYFIDTDRISDDWWFPWSWKHYTRSTLWDNGASFYSERIVIVDGAITRRPYPPLRMPVAKLPTVPELAIGSKEPLTRQEQLLFMFNHEFAHMIDLKYMSIPDTARQYYVQGTKAMYSENFVEAEGMFRKALGEFPWYPDALDHLGISARRRGKWGEALSCYERSLEISPNGEVALQNLIPVLMKKGDIDRALIAAGTLTVEHPGNPEGPFWKGQLLTNMEKWAEAVPELEHARELYLSRQSPGIVDVDVLRAKAFRQLGEYGQARLANSDLENSCRLYPMRSRDVPECAAIANQVAR
jgi:hypothetical protein